MNHPIIRSLALLVAISISWPTFATKVVHDARALNSSHWTLEPGAAGESSAIMFRIDKRCSVLGVGALNPNTFRVNVQLKRMTCQERSGNLIESPARGFVVGKDNREGVPIQCLDTYKNENGALMCMSATLPAGSAVSIVLSDSHE